MCSSGTHFLFKLIPYAGIIRIRSKDWGKPLSAKTALLNYFYYFYYI